MTFALAAAFLLAGPPRFLGPPEKKPPEGEAAAVSPGDAAPPFAGAVENAKAAGTDRVDLAALIASPAKALLISFFSSACEACRKELAVLQQISTGSAKRGLRVVGIWLDGDARLLQQSQVTYPVIADRDHRIARQYLGENLRFPSLAIVDASGKIVSVKKGYTGDPATFLPAQVDGVLR